MSPHDGRYRYTPVGVIELENVFKSEQTNGGLANSVFLF